MQKILFVSSKHLSKDLLDGAQKRAYQIMRSLSKSGKIDFVCADNSSLNKAHKLEFCSKKIFFKVNFLSRIINTINSILKFEPMQNGFFYSKEMSNFIFENKENYDVIIFHLTRCACYLPREYRGKTILESTDLVSANYEQIVENFSFLNPVKYIYWFEKILMKSYEKKIFGLFDNIIFISKNEFSKIKYIDEKNKILNIENSFDIKKKLFKYNKNNFKIFFIGNINYLPNKLACYNFAKNILPKINKKNSRIEFHIIGKINYFDKFFLQGPNVKVHGAIKKLENVLREAICGLCNLEIATGLQNKIFTYMSYGLPPVISEKSYPKSLLKKNKEVLVYNNEKQLINHIFKLIENKKFSNKISKNAHICIRKKFGFPKTYGKYIKLIKS